MLDKKNIAAFVAEFLGTGLLTAVVLAVSKSTIGVPYFVGLAAGLAIVVGTIAFGRVSGAHFNPAITLSLWSVRKVKTVQAVAFVAAQLLGGIAAYYLFSYFVGQTWHNTGEYQTRVLVAEAVGAFVFGLGWAAAVYDRLDNSKAAVTVGVSLFLGILIASVGGGGVINPAVALGAHSWVLGTFVLGPVLGAVVGFHVYNLFFAENPTSYKVVAAKAAKPADAKKKVADKAKKAKTTKTTKRKK